jgi:hypothetical protein
MPVFIVATVVSLVFNDTIFKIGTFKGTKILFCLVVLGVLVFVYYKLLTYMINETCQVVREKIKNGYSLTKVNTFIVYLSMGIISTLIYVVLYILVTHFWFRIW